MPSICQDATFRAFRTLISQTQQNHTWELVLSNQVFPDPKQLLCDRSFCSIITRTEPGISLDYAQIRNQSAKISGTPDQRLRTAKVCNDLENAHRNYLQAGACVEGYRLYDKIIDIFYRKVTDHEFQQFIARNSDVQAQMTWPAYEAVKKLNRVKLNNWLRELQRCSTIVHEIKNSATTKHFLTQLEIAHETEATQAVQRPETSIAAPKSVMTLAERKRAIERRNRMTRRARFRANEGMRTYNKNNIHQFGEQGRHPNSDRVISKISRALKEFKEKQTTVLPGELHEYKKQLEESGMKAPMVELALEEAKEVWEANARQDMSEHFEFAEGFSNVSNTGVEPEDQNGAGQ